MAFIIDPGSNGEFLYSYVQKNKLKVQKILATHGHADHIAGIPYLKRVLCAEFMLHKADECFLTDASLNLSEFLGLKVDNLSCDAFLQEDLVLTAESMALKVLHTPGHTPGSVCFLADNLLFSGDVIFNEGIGRVDLPGGDSNKLKESISMLLTLPDEIFVYPGHGEETTIGNFRRWYLGL